MIQELRKFAQEILKFVDDSDYYGWDTSQETSKALIKKSAMISKSFLDEHPEDGDVELDQRWLDDQGLGMFCGEGYAPRPDLIYGKYDNTIGIINFNDEWQVVVQDHTGDIMLTIAMVKTRDDVRRLMSVLDRK